MLKLGVLVSGGGTNLQAIIDKIESKYIDKACIEIVISSRNDAYALQRSKRHGIEAKYLLKKDFKSLEDYNRAMILEFEKRDVGLVITAGFNQILSEEFIRKFENRIMNIHPSLVPSFSGKGFYGLIPHKKALEYGVKITGATVHFVELETDTGPVILQKAVNIHDDDTPESLQKRVMEEAEWDILPLAIKLFSEGKIRIDGRKVQIIN